MRRLFVIEGLRAGLVISVDTPIEPEEGQRIGLTAREPLLCEAKSAEDLAHLFVTLTKATTPTASTTTKQHTTAIEPSTMSEQERAEIPPEFLCPITNEIMQDPVMSRFGHAYERSAIVEWLASHSHTCPLTRKKMQLSDLITHPSLRIAIRQWQIDNQEDVTVLGPEDSERTVIVGSFDLPLKADFDESERTETSDSEQEDAGSNLERYLAERQRNTRSTLTGRRTSQQQHRRWQERARSAANHRSAQAFLENHRRRILSYLRSEIA